MTDILVLGAGRSSGYLIGYLLQWCRKHGGQVTVSDLQPGPASTNAAFVPCDLRNPQERRKLIAGRTLVVSMLPAFMHPEVAADCLAEGVHMATASYESPVLREMAPAVKAAGLWFLNECGLDPGLDHMSAMDIFDRLRGEGAHITGFRSYCGGLVTPESCDNSWGYKFSWNPRNVILAGQGAASYLEGGTERFLPYHRLFGSAETISVGKETQFDAYPNRDSLSYKTIYGLDGIQDLLRGTLRNHGFCKAWNVFVQLGITDDTYLFPLKSGLTYRMFISSFLPGTGDPEIRLLTSPELACDAASLHMIRETGLLSDEVIPLTQGSPAAILQALLEKKWKLHPTDRDLVVMHHIVDYQPESGSPRRRTSSLIVAGESEVQTAMAKTVGLPLAITICRLLENPGSKTGLLLPVSRDLYEPVLKQLDEEFGIGFREEDQNR